MNIQKQTDYCVRNLYMGRLVSSLLACFALVLFLVPAYANVGATSLTWEEYAKEVACLKKVSVSMRTGPLLKRRN